MQLHTGSPSTGLECLEEEWDSYSVAGGAETHRDDSVVVSDFFLCLAQTECVYLFAAQGRVLTCRCLWVVG